MQTQLSTPFTFAATTSSQKLLINRTGSYVRTQFVVTNTSATTVTLIKGDQQAAVAGVGILILQNGTYQESTDSGFTCWQGEIQVVASGASTVVGVESVIEIG